ncbi:TIGR01666 family membrane protein [Rhodoferax lacus]|uniref:TIGR01666 family membrane protein n=1 Tax=Rhodoferax lacus TaxID=2184758 RepID=A0A3E1RGR4_9BURK|nr:YccS family putative transporter [Rhodoferax lacus]RFO98549.1 TIGR01666 family membrane protein [Rhodoferax lacus]
MNDNWIANWKRTLNHEGVTRGAQALLALGCVLALGWKAEWQEELMPVVLGVLASAFTETDDNWSGRLKAQLLALGAFALVSAAVWAALPSPLTLAAVLALCAFVLTMLGALGERYRAIAFGALVLFIYTALSAQNRRDHALEVAPYLLGGAAWYGLVSLCWAAAWPRPTVRHRLSRLYALLGEYLRLKSQLLEPVSDMDLSGRRLELALHNGRVVDALNSTKDSLFSRLGSGTPSAWMQEAMRQYLAAQDIHERVSSSHESYAVLAEAFPRSDALYRCQRVLGLLGEQAHKFARAIRDRTEAQHAGTTARAIDDMQAAIRHLDTTQTGPALQRPLRAMHALGDNLTRLASVFANAMRHGGTAPDLSLFDRQPQTLREAWGRVRAQLTLGSSLMRHALRLALALVAAYAVMWATHDPHGYWILLTVLFTSQPHYAATLSRAVQRAVGTVLGLAVGWALIRLFPGALMQAVCMVVAGALFIGKRQTDLRTAAGAITALVLLSFHQMGMSQGVIPARLLDAAVGSAISALAAWLVLPNWHARQLPQIAAQALRAQAGYLVEILLQYQNGKQDHLAYRLARRNAHNADAALANAFGAMCLEPPSTRLNEAACGQFVVLSHMLLNFLSALGAHRGEIEVGTPDPLARQAADQLLQGLKSLSHLLEQSQGRMPVVSGRDASGSPVEVDVSTPIQSLLLSQLRLANRLLPELGKQALRFRGVP